MARRKIVYEPGELERTRRNLGDIDRDEARRMAEVLGGEVGIERVAPAKKPSSETPGAPPADTKPKAAATGKNLNWAGEPDGPSRPAAAYRASTAQNFPVEQKWSLRVKIDFLSARGDFMVKTQFQALLSLFRISPDARDPVNPEFINITCAQAFSLVEGIQRALKTLLPPRRVELWEILKRAPYHHAILSCLATWSVQSLSDSLNRLQRAPGSVVMRDLLPFAKLLFGPLFKLRDAVEGMGFKSAVNSAWTIAKEASPNDLDALTVARAELEDKMDRLYRGMSYRWVPVFMKFCAERMYEPEEFQEQCKDRVLRLLDVSDLEVIRPPRSPVPGESVPEPAEEVATEAEPEEEPAEAPKEEIPGEKPIPPAVLAGLDILDKLYPEAGMGDLDDWPDLYPYFNQVYSLPRGLDLVSTYDPITQIVVLAHILDDLFHGLRAVKFGIGTDEKAEDLNDRIFNLIGEWPGAWEEVLVKSYLPLLSEYCRLLETERESRTSPYAARREADLIWFKKRYYLPFVSGTALSVNQPPRGHDRPALFKLCSEIKGYLTMIAQDIDRAVKARPEGDKLLSVPTVANPLDVAMFEVENPTSKRIRQLLKFEGSVPRKFTNSALIYYSLAITTVLDYLMNDRHSWAYQPSSSLPYRPLEGGATPYVDKMEKGPDYIFSMQIEQMAVRRSRREAEARAATASAAMGLRLSKDAQRAGAGKPPSAAEAPLPGAAAPAQDKPAGTTESGKP